MFVSRHHYPQQIHENGNNGHSFTFAIIGEVELHNTYSVDFQKCSSVFSSNDSNGSLRKRTTAFFLLSKSAIWCYASAPTRRTSSPTVTTEDRLEIVDLYL